MWPPSITNIMRKTLLTILALGAVAMMSCSKDNTPSQPVWPDDKDDETTETVEKPLDGGNIVVAHRGGSTEAGKGFPDNSIASLEYAMSLKCYASECDIYWTKDNKVVVAHADSECKINGVHPWEATLAELRAKGNIGNGDEQGQLHETVAGHKEHHQSEHIDWISYQCLQKVL